MVYDHPKIEDIPTKSKIKRKEICEYAYISPSLSAINGFWDIVFFVSVSFIFKIKYIATA